MCYEMKGKKVNELICLRMAIPNTLSPKICEEYRTSSKFVDIPMISKKGMCLRNRKGWK